MARVLKLERELTALPEMSVQELRESWNTVGSGTAPKVPPTILRQLLAQRLQERRHGALPALVARELSRVATEGSSAAPVRSQVALTPGTRLVREWNGQTITVEVLDEGFSYADRTWRSLSEIARHVTGAHWSGPRFFGLTANG